VDPLSSDWWTRVRADFPYASECVYLNTAAAGLSWKGQGAAAARFYDEAKRQGMNGMPHWRKVRQDATTRIARLVGVREDEIHFVGSTTEGLNLVASAVRWHPGDEIVVLADEFPSVLFACENAERAGATVRRIPVQSESQRDAALVDALTPATRMVAASQVHWATGTRLDLTRLSTACRGNGTLLMVDGVQALGAVPADLGETDVYCASTFKWLVSGFGLAILVVRDRLQGELVPAMRGYNNPAPSTELHYSHVNYPGIYALAATLEFLETIGWDRIYARVDTLASELAAVLRERGVDVVTPDDAHAGIVSCVLSDPASVRDKLVSRDTYVGAREGLLRTSAHFYNDVDDIRTFGDALSALL
jgi:cysteine desulfurase / selenocysteine lyase